MRNHFVWPFLVVSLATLAGCAGGSKKPSARSTRGGVKVETYDFRFEPTTVNVEPGKLLTITIKNEGKAEHNFSIDSLSVTKDVEKGETATVSFRAPASPGDVQFYCKYHRTRGMAGTLHVSM